MLRHRVRQHKVIGENRRPAVQHAVKSQFIARRQVIARQQCGLPQQAKRKGHTDREFHSSVRFHYICHPAARFGNGIYIWFFNYLFKRKQGIRSSGTSKV